MGLLLYALYAYLKRQLAKPKTVNDLDASLGWGLGHVSAACSTARVLPGDHCPRYLNSMIQGEQRGSLSCGTGTTLSSHALYFNLPKMASNLPFSYDTVRHSSYSRYMFQKPSGRTYTPHLPTEPHGQKAPLLRHHRDQNTASFP